VCKCGQVHQTKIVGGQETNEFKYQWMAMLVSKGSKFSFCGATLISPTWLLSAAHCTLSRTAAQLEVRLGVHDRTTDPASEVRRQLLQIVMHPQYSASTNSYDFALLRIDAIDVAASQFISPICLPTTSNSFAGTTAVSAGWGRKYSGGPTTNKLHEVSVPVISNTECYRNYGTTAITDSMLCAGERGKDSCQGDSGGPLMYSEASGSKPYMKLIGVVSWGSGCGSDNPGVYARVTNQLTWINSITSASATCTPWS